MKKRYLLIAGILSCTLLLGCGQNSVEPAASVGTSGEDQNFENDPRLTGMIEINPDFETFPGNADTDIETMRENAADYVANLPDAVNRLKEDMDSEKATEEAIEKGNQLLEEKGERIEELVNMDFSEMSEGEISAITSETTEIITDIRQIRNMIAGF